MTDAPGLLRNSHDDANAFVLGSPTTPALVKVPHPEPVPQSAREAARSSRAGVGSPETGRQPSIASR
jgi:hypothetical protein